MPATTISQEVIITGDDLQVPSPHLYAYFDCIQETDDKVVTDRSGNGHHLNWDTIATHNTVPSGYRTSNYIQFPASPSVNDVWIASSASEFPMQNLNYSWIQIVRGLIGTAPAASNAFGINKRGAVSGATDAGFTMAVASSQRYQCQLHNGSAQVGLSSPTTFITTNDMMTAMMAWDQVAKQLSCYVASDATFRQYETDVQDGSGYDLDYGASSTQVAALGSRSKSLAASDVSKDTQIHFLQVYVDTAGGALPEKLGNLARYLHQNPNTLIPASIWG